MTSNVTGNEHWIYKLQQIYISNSETTHMNASIYVVIT